MLDRAAHAQRCRAGSVSRGMADARVGKFGPKQPVVFRVTQRVRPPGCLCVGPREDRRTPQSR